MISTKLVKWPAVWAHVFVDADYLAISRHEIFLSVFYDYYNIKHINFVVNRIPIRFCLRCTYYIQLFEEQSCREV